MPRKYQITGPDGNRYQFDWDYDSDPTEAEIDAMFAKSATPMEMPAPSSQPEGFFGRSMDVLGRVGNTLSRLTGGSAVAAGIDAYQTDKPILGAIADAYTPTGIGTFKSNPSGDKILENAGMDQGIGRAIAGFGIDVVTDPGNLLGGSILKAPKLLGMSDDIGKGLGKVADAIPGISHAKKGITNAFALRPQTAGIASSLGDVEYNDLARLYDSGARAAGEGAESLAESMFKINGKLMPVADRQRLAHALDTGNFTSLSPDEFKVAQKFRDQMDYLHGQQVTLGTLTPEQKMKNYVQYLTKDGRDVEAVVAPNISAVPQSARKREVFQTLQEAVDKGGATDDALEILATSTAQVEKAKNKVEFLDEIAKRYQTLDGRALNFKNLNVSDKVKTRLQDVKLDPRIAEDLERAIKVWESPTEMDNLIITANKLFKGATTAVVPSHHINNFVGNIHNLYVSGMDVKDIGTNMVHAYKVIASRSDPAQQAQLLNGLGKYSGKEILNAAKKFEVLGTSTHLGDLGTEGTSKIVNNWAFRTGRKIGTDYIEEPARLALFMNEIKQGKTLEQAAIKVKNVLFDYTELTKNERAIRDYGFIPFYTWMRKNIPLQIESAMKHPEKMEAVTNLMNVPWNANDTSEWVIPEERQRGGYVPFKAQTEGDLPAMVRWALPSYDVGKATDPGGLLRDSLGPLPKLAYEYAMKTRMNGAPIHSRTGFSRPAGMANVLSPLNRVLPEQAQGWVTPTTVGGRPAQRDIPSWLMGAIPTSFLGSSMQSADPLSPQFDSQAAEIALRVLGFTPDVLSPNDQKYEAIRRKTDLRRDAIQRIIMEQ